MAIITPKNSYRGRIAGMTKAQLKAMISTESAHTHASHDHGHLDGPLGIGTESPSNTVQINHTGADSDNGLLIVRADASTNTGDLLGGIGFDSTDGNVPSTITEASAYIAAYAEEGHGTTDKGGYLVLGTSKENENDDTVSNEVLRIQDSGKVSLNYAGDTAEASQTPSLDLYVYSDTATDAAALRFFKADGTAASRGDTDDSDDLGAIMWYSYNSVLGDYNRSADIFVEQYGTKGDGDAAGANMFVRLTDDSGVNVHNVVRFGGDKTVTLYGREWISNTSISALDDVGAPSNYHLYLQGDTTNNKSAGICFGSSADNVGAAIIYKDVGSFAQGELQFYTKTSTSDEADPVQRMTISQAGNVGIGTTDPKVPVDIYEMGGLLLGYTMLNNNDASLNASYTLTTSYVVPSSDWKVTFVAPASGKVEIEFFGYLASAHTGNQYVYLGLSTASSWNSLGSAYEKQVAEPDEDDNLNIVQRWYLTGLTAGTSYTYYIGTKHTGGSGFWRYGGTNADLMPPIIIKATSLPNTVHTD